MAKVDNREKLVNELIEETKPEKTGTFCFDFFNWDEHQPVLHLEGDHGTPDFTLTFLAGARVLVSLDSNPSWAKVVESVYDNPNKLAKDILVTMAVIQLIGAL